VLVPHSVESMFDLIEQAEAYPQFLPWCSGARVLERSDEWVAARIEFSYRQLRFGFETRNPKRRPEWLQVRMVDGPFRHFQADWRLTPLGGLGCRISFELSYEISNSLLDKVAATAVDRVSRAMVDAFVKRADETLGTSDLSSKCGFATLLDPHGGRPASAGLGALKSTDVQSFCSSIPVVAAVSTVINCREISVNSSDTDLYDAVRACPLAVDLDPAQTALLAGLLVLESVQAGQVLAREATTDSRLYIVVDGSLSVIRSLGTAQETLIATLTAGDFAHELGFLDGSVRYASLVAGTHARVLVLERDKLESLIERQPQTLYRVMCAIVRTVHRVQTRLAMQTSELTNYIFKQHGRY
jgi:ribosome-associated toxin RatA of RatAB toxin-antitoxin module/CRP-like cAMP-binding protein